MGEVTGGLGVSSDGIGDLSLHPMKKSKSCLGLWMVVGVPSDSAAV